MKTIFLETNAINKYISYSGSENLSNIMKLKNITPVVSIHTTYELYRIFLSDEKEKGIQLFQGLKNIDPIYSCSTQTLLKREIEKLRHGTSVNYFIEELYLSCLKEKISNISDGLLEEGSLSFVDDRERRIEEFHNHIDIYSEEASTINPNSTSFDDYVEEIKRKDLISLIKNIITSSVNVNMTDIEVNTILDNQLSYPALYCLIRAQLFFNYAIRVSGGRPAKDKTDDLRHVIDASYCSIFVSNDSKLLRDISKINPNVAPIKFENIFDL
jgi:hypothetical protein